MTKNSIIIFVYIILLLTPTKSFSQIPSPHYFSSEHKLSFMYDSAFLPQQHLSPSQLVLLKPTMQAYPEFEIQKIKTLEETEALSAQDFADQQTMELARIGIVDVKVLETKRYHITQSDHWMTELRYPLADKVILAAIIVVPGEGDISYRLIYRDIVASYFRHKSLRNQIFDSFQLGKNALPVVLPNATLSLAPPTIVKESSSESFLVYWIALLVFLFFIWQVKRKSRC